MAQNHFININSYNSYLTSFNTTGITSNMSNLVLCYSDCSHIYWGGWVIQNYRTRSNVLLASGQEDQCEQSEHVEDISKLESCNGVGTFISVIYRPPSGASNCSSIDDDYHILIYHHDFDRSITIEKHPPPERHNETACLVHLTLGPDIFVIENNDTLLQVWMKLITMPAVTYCSNNFTLLVDTGRSLYYKENIYYI